MPLIDSRELAKRWCVPESWIRERTRARTTDPIPHVRLGRYVRFDWLSPELASDRPLIALRRAWFASSIDQQPDDCSWPHGLGTRRFRAPMRRISARAGVARIRGTGRLWRDWLGLRRTRKASNPADRRGQLTLNLNPASA
jgi:hypothetical protein